MEKTIKAAYTGAKGFKALVESASGVYVSSPSDGRIFRGDLAANAVRAAGFEVVPWAGPRDPRMTDRQWKLTLARTSTFKALTPVGALIVP
jgi:hypothetical protein